MRVEVPARSEQPPFVYITAMWKDIYDPRSVSMSYGKIDGMEMYLSIAPERFEDVWRHRVDSVIHLLWDHELHEYLQFDGKCLHEPHPEGRDGPLG